MKKLLSKKAFIFIMLLSLFSAMATAQSKPAKLNYKKHPVWIQMMNDTSANYFETVKAFREFFKKRFLPEEPWEKENSGGDAFEKEVGLEDENEGGKKSEREKEREKRKQNANEPNYAAEVRAFKSWFYSIKPWVRADGSIIGPLEQQAIIDRQQSELKAIEKANGKN